MNVLSCISPWFNHEKMVEGRDENVVDLFCF